MIDNGKTVPQYIFKLMNKMVGQRIGGGGRAVDVHIAGQQGILLYKSEVIITERSAGKDGLAVLFLDNEHKLRIVNSLTTDLFGSTIKLNFLKERDGRMISMPRIPIVSGIYAYMVMDPVELLPLIEQELKSSQMNSEKRKQLENLVTNLDEYSNPVLIIGKTK